MSNTNSNESKLLTIGRAWINDRVNQKGTSPKMTIRIDKNLGLGITLKAGDNLVLFANEKREGERGKQDPDFRVAAAVPADIADKEINRQKALRNTTVTVQAV